MQWQSGGWGCQLPRPKPKSQPALMTQMLHLLPHKREFLNGWRVESFPIEAAGREYFMPHGGRRPRVFYAPWRPQAASLLCPMEAAGRDFSMPHGGQRPRFLYAPSSSQANSSLCPMEAAGRKLFRSVQGPPQEQGKIRPDGRIFACKT